MSTYNQLLLTSVGGSFDLQAGSKPEVGPDEILLRQRVIALNPVDFKKRKYGFRIDKWPHILGVEGAGVVEAVGQDVVGIEQGDEVFGYISSGAYQEAPVVSATAVAKKPRNMSLTDAASLPISYQTALAAISLAGVSLPFTTVKLASSVTPKSVLILGASSGVGSATVQLLRKAYPSLPIFGTSDPKHDDLLLPLGFTKLFNRYSTNLIDEVRSSSPGSGGVDMIIDCVGAGASQPAICDALDNAGLRIYSEVLTGMSVSAPDNVKKIDVVGPLLATLPGGLAALPALTALVEQGDYRRALPVRVVGHGLESIPGVLDQVMSTSAEKLIVLLE